MNQFLTSPLVEALLLVLTVFVLAGTLAGALRLFAEWLGHAMGLAPVPARVRSRRAVGVERAFARRYEFTE